MTVKVYDNGGLNFTIKSRNALTIVESLLHSIKRNYVVIDFRHSANDHTCDFIVLLDE